MGRKRKVQIPCVRCGELTFSLKYCPECAVIMREEKINAKRQENIDEFKRKRKDYKNKNKEAIKESSRLYYINNKDKINESNRNYYKNNIDKERERKKIFKELNPEKLKEHWRSFYIRNKDFINKKSTEWRKNNPEKYKEIHNKSNKKRRENRKEYDYRKSRRETDLNFRLTDNLRVSLRRSLKRGMVKRSDTLIELIGCSIDFLLTHLENQFVEGMSWDNYGKCGWEVDHIIPCDSFDFTKIEQQKECFHYTNLQPLWGEINRKKTNKLDFVYP